ncbi:uncharacterized protein TNIN_420261 [Trichonephila inaurata madagascariensis]|uniref:Uncharacterized protein n=1 Tax=Trichonephila inaurata madagascariensis TaxID=2747483 RepID=A0A8X6WVY6_9ARAC|nr:uncharacterized protein TNIN_420261 [Trichonephila inaurata madagascariensis]
MESLKIEYYEILEEEKLPKLELTFDQMEEDLESIKVGLQTLLLKHDDISKNVSICDTALSNNDNSKSSFVKLPDLQRIGFVKEFTKKPCEHNPDYLDEFESAVVELYEKFTVVVKSAKKRAEDSSQNLQEVSDMNQNQEESRNGNSYTADNVQIRVSSEEMRRRIEAFKLGRRRLKDERNVQEYCGRPYIEELHPLWSKYNYSCVLECYLNAGSTSNESAPPKKQNTDKYAVKREAETDKYDNWSIDDVQRRIDFLTESLKSKYPAAKNL